MKLLVGKNNNNEKIWRMVFIVFNNEIDLYEINYFRLLNIIMFDIKIFMTVLT